MEYPILNGEPRVIPLDKAKKLKELKVPQEAAHYWVEWPDRAEVVSQDNPVSTDGAQIYAAYTDGELIYLNGPQTEFMYHPLCFIVKHYVARGKKFESRNLANALAELLIYRILNKLL